MLWEYVESVIPTIGVSLIFWIAIRAIIQADRRERAAQARIEAEQDRAAASAAPPEPPADR